MESPPPWPSDWVHLGPLQPPERWQRPGLAVVFNLECPGCVSRGIPWLKRLAASEGERLTLFAVHSAYGHRSLAREAVVPQLTHYAASFAELPFPVALDLDGSWAQAMGAEGTPHWFVWDAGGTLVRSVYGSQENAQTRLSYLLEELLQGG
jgi:hypothetical protein